MWNIGNPFKRKKNPDKNPDKVKAGIRSGEARRLKKLDKMIMDDILDKNPELAIIRDLGNHYDIELSDKQLIALLPKLMAFSKRLNEIEAPIRWDF